MGVVTVRALGGFDLFVGGRPATPTAPKPRQILAVLALRRAETVSVDTLVDELWGDRPPRGAVAALQTHVYELRKELRSTQAGAILVTGRSGYAVDLPPRHLDVTRFDEHIAAGAAALGRDDPVTARRHLLGALRLSTAHPLANVRCGGFLAGQVVRLQEARLRATELKLEADLRLGRHDEVIGDLRVAVADHPYHEGFVLKLMVTLHRRGRRGEAVAAFHALRERLVADLGVEPGSDLQQLHQSLIHGGRRPGAVSESRSPAQLPRGVDDFTGREAPLAEAAAHLLKRSARGSSPVVALSGMAGVGKTATAVHLAHAVRDHFPDGQLYLDGEAREMARPAADLATRLLHGCGVKAEGQDPVAGFRSWSAGRRMLIVLDDVAADQAESLLPSGSGCAVIVTSRSVRVPPDALAVSLYPMDPDEGVALLARLVPGNRIQGESSAAKGIVNVVGGLPLALRHLARWIAATPAQRLDAFLAMLTDALETQPLSRVSVLGPRLHSSLYSAYLGLGSDDQHAFRMLALLRTDDFTTDEAARALLLESAGAEMTLLRLADPHLVRPLGDGRWAIPTLVRRLSLECLAELSSGSGPTCTGPPPARRGRRPAPWSAR